MNFIEIRNQFISLFNSLKKESIQVYNNFEKFELVTKEDKELIVKDIEDSYKIEFDPRMKEILIPNLSICWHYNINGKNETGGEFNLRGTPALLNDTSKTSFSDSLTSYGKKLYKDGYRFFDSHPNAGDGFFAAIQIEKNTITDTVWFVDIIHENIEPMELDYPAYIEHTIKLKGLYDWQYLFMEDNLNNLDFDITPLRKRLEDYPKLFPGSDVSEYMKLYKEKGGE
jgi:hypothetical protein